MRFLEVGTDGRVDVINIDNVQVMVPQYAVNQGSDEPEVLDANDTADLAVYQTLTNGSDTITVVVPDGTVEGQCKRFTNIPDQTAQIEPTTARWSSGIVDMTVAGDYVLLQWTRTGWVILERSPSSTTNRS